eukprot:jgi/Mesvir1/27235/Mv07078-RA.1
MGTNVGGHARTGAGGDTATVAGGDGDPRARTEQPARGELSDAPPVGPPPDVDQQETTFLVSLDPRPRPDRAGSSSLRPAEGPSGPTTSARHSHRSAEEHCLHTRAETPLRVAEGPSETGILVPAEPVVRLEALVAAVQSGQDLLQRLLVQQGRQGDHSAATSVGYDAASRAPGSSYDEWSMGDFIRAVPGRVVRFRCHYRNQPSLIFLSWRGILCGLVRKIGGIGDISHVDGVGHVVAPPKVAPTEGRAFLDRTMLDFAGAQKAVIDDDHVRTEVFQLVKELNEETFNPRVFLARLWPGG